MMYLYLTVFLVGLIIIPIVAGVVFHNEKQAQKGKRFPDDPDGFDYFMGSGVAIIALLFWPIILPCAAILYAGFILFKLPQVVLEAREAKKDSKK